MSTSDAANAVMGLLGLGALYFYVWMLLMSFLIPITLLAVITNLRRIARGIDRLAPPAPQWEAPAPVAAADPEPVHAAPSLGHRLLR